MKRTIALILLFFMVLLGGCQMGRELKPSEMHPDDLPDERAFQDEFTREFLQSTEETRPGYYPFLSKTGKYTMNFPEGGIITKPAYEIKNRSFEYLDINISFADKTAASLMVMYYGGNLDDRVDIHLDWFSGRLGETINFAEMKEKYQTVYYSSFQRNDFNYLVAYIQNLYEPGGIELSYVIDCLDNDCSGDNAMNENHFLEFVSTIQFIKDYESVDK